MSLLDWVVLLGTLGFIVSYGVWKTRRDNTRENYLRGGADDRWWGVGLSVMATQASAITFLSTPGQGYADGMGFVQFYFGLPFAMLVVGGVFIPLYYKWKVYTAYEFIGRRFDDRARLLTAGLFLLQRSMAAGITIYAPSIILCKILHWPLSLTCVFIGALVILYTTTGGARAVGVTHKQQMTVMILGIVTAFVLIVHSLSTSVSFGESLALAGAMGKLDVVNLSWNPNDKYTLWTGLIGGFFLQLSYFGTDQSQVQRYLTGQSARQARLGLLMNGVLKIPMQFFILLTGVLVFDFYLFHPTPLHWNEANLVSARSVDATSTRSVDATSTRSADATSTRSADANSNGSIDARPNGSADAKPNGSADESSNRTPDAMSNPRADAMSSPRADAPSTTRELELAHSAAAEQREKLAGQLVADWRANDTARADATLAKLKSVERQDTELRGKFRKHLSAVVPAAEPNDKDYIFITFVMDHLPMGIIGLLLAMIFCAGMSSTSAELSALATTWTVDVSRKQRSDRDQVRATQWATVAFGLLALGYAALFSLFENLIQAVNILGSLFYGTILGIFLVAFFVRGVQARAVFVAALIAEAAILVIHFAGIEIAFLWYNLIAPAILVVLAIVLQRVLPKPVT